MPAQVRQLLFPGVPNNKKPEQRLETERVFKARSGPRPCFPSFCLPHARLSDVSTLVRRS